LMPPRKVWAMPGRVQTRVRVKAMRLKRVILGFRDAECILPPQK
jgi:hypothetical protein